MSDELALKYTQAYSVDCHDLDEFVNHHLEKYGKTWRSLDTGEDGFNNGSFVSAHVRLGAEIEDDEGQDFSRWLTNQGPFYFDPEGGPCLYDLPDIYHMLQWLCNAGKILPGKYIVKLWW